MAETDASRPLPARVIARALTLKPVRAFLLYSEHRGPVLADSVTYRTLFSVFAGVLLGFSVAALWLSGNPVAWQSLIDAVDAVVPGLVGEGGLVKLDDIQAPAGLTIAGIISVVGLVGASIGAIGSLRTALRLLADTANDDAFFLWVMLRNLLLAIGIGVALAASAAVSFLATSGIEIVNGWIGLSATHPIAAAVTRMVSILLVFALDAAIIAALFVALSGIKPSARSLWSGALLGGVGLVVLQQLSSLFVGGAGSNPLLTTFASLIALLLWLNLSTQVILIASAYIITGVEEERDRVRARFGASTFAQRRVAQAERAVQVAADELNRARTGEEAERAAAVKAKPGTERRGD
ncbi:MAG: YihY/virulence factor BrkB family protein [Actinobacteria bacterium]|nr:YihY/virulence factor BrkB family protein [Actinomycetota bacterium]